MSAITLSEERALRAVPLQYRDLSTWPLVDESLLSSEDRKRLARYQRALEVKLAGRSNADAAKLAGTTVREFSRVLKRCVAIHPDGRIWGLRALLKGTRVFAPKRTAQHQNFDAHPKAGFSGLFNKLLEEHPSIERDLVFALTTARQQMPSLNKLSTRQIHRIFLKLCTDAGIGEDEYPFNTQHKARRTLRNWLQSVFLPKHAAAWTRAEHGDQAGQAFGYQGGDGSSTRLLGAYRIWQMDEVTIDQEGRYELPNAKGDWEQIELRRCSAIRLIEIGTTSTLAWKLVLAPQPTAEDLLTVIWDAMNGPPKVPAAVPGLDYMEGAGYPANVHPQLRYAEPSIIELDNALSHLSDKLQTLLLGTCGSVIRLGKPATPQARANIEAKFKLQAQRVVHQLPSTTGSGPQDPVRKKSKVPVDKRVLVNELEHVLDVYQANENATPAAGAGYEAPLERLRRQIEAQAIKVNYLPVARRKPHFFNSLHRVSLKVDVDRGRRPHINFLGARYSSPQLQRAYTLVGVPLWVRFDPRDLRTLIVFQDDGTEFGAVTALGQWGRFQHDTRIRKLYLKLKRAGELVERPEDGPLDALLAHLRAGAPRDRTKGLQLANLMNTLSRPMVGAERAQEAAEDARREQAALEAFDTVAEGTPEAAPAMPPQRRDAANDTPPAEPMSSRVHRLPRRAARR